MDRPVDLRVRPDRAGRRLRKMQRAALDVGCGAGRLMADGHGFRTTASTRSGDDRPRTGPAPLSVSMRHLRVGTAPVVRPDGTACGMSHWTGRGRSWRSCAGGAAGGSSFTDGRDVRPGGEAGLAHGAAHVPRHPRPPRHPDALAEAGCVVRHLEYDQHPELHVAIILPRSRYLTCRRLRSGSARSSRVT